MIFNVLTLFPELINYFTDWSIVKRGIESEKFFVNIVDIRDYSLNKHKKVDDYPYGGGPGMLMAPEPIYRALESVEANKKKVIYLSPQGEILKQSKAKELSSLDEIVLLCGHYEGIDNRIIENYVDEEISIGDYILTGGEIPALVLIETIIRLLPGVLGNEEGHIDESLNNNLLEHPQYTRPREFNGLGVPEVLVSGHHEKINKWKNYKRIETTYKKRPDLLERAILSENDKNILNEIINKEREED